MDSQQIVSLLAHLKAKNVAASGPWVRSSCVLAPWNHDSGKDSSPSFAIRIDQNKTSYFNCFVCKHGKLADLLLELQHHKAHLLGYDLAAAWKLVHADEEHKLALKIKDWGESTATQSEDLVMPDWWLDSFQHAWPVPYAREYLEKRQVTKEVHDELDIRWDRSKLTVCFPIRNGSGELVSMRGRRIDPSPGTPSYHVYKFYGQQAGGCWLGEHNVNYDKPVLMVESVFDYTSVKRVYANVVAPLSVGINAARMKRVSKCTEVVTYFDQGVGGDKARQIVSKHLGSALITHIIPKAKDPGELSEEAIRGQLSFYLNLKSKPPLQGESIQ